MHHTYFILASKIHTIYEKTAVALLYTQVRNCSSYTQTQYERFS